MRKNTSITVDINGITYSAEAIDRVASDNKKVIVGTTIVITTVDQDCSQLDNLTVGSTDTITDKGVPGYYTGNYIYSGSNDKQHIFERKD
ncbi:hypothetical protein AAGQ96_13050 [Pantoea sp. MBD-2R]|uniref:hypothetical protein n=1 Tax=Pantoea sp. MBD-2R TaxID=3141540 RepID=UPI0031831DA8